MGERAIIQLTFDIKMWLIGFQLENFGGLKSLYINIPLFQLSIDFKKKTESNDWFGLIVRV